MKQIFIFSLLLFLFINLQSQAQQNNFWTFSEIEGVYIPGTKKIKPDVLSTVKLNTSHFQIFQSQIPHENSGLYNLIALPTPDGQFKMFRIFEYDMMEKPLADKYPFIKTYTAICTENEWITAKIDFTLFGFHAMIYDGDETYFIDPITDINTDWYQVYYKKDYHKPLNDRMACHFDEETFLSNEATAISLNETPATPQPLNLYKQNGSNKRNYKLALACTEEYAAAVGGQVPTKASVLSAMVTTMNRVNGVFQRDFSKTTTLVANNDTLIFLANDPYTNNNGATMLGQNQTTVTNRIGSANYNYGHVFSTGGGGIASLGCVCNNNSKAQGVTGLPNPVGDAFDIDYVAHEMGHQFGGSHTFNSVTGSCSGNRSGTSAYEIGSATTIMGYAGICGTDNIQNNSDDYYHIRSLEQMTANSVMACATNTPSGNQLPILTEILNTHIIPYLTNFELTATGTDADNNPLTYCWEEWDRGGSGGAWDAPTTVAPLLRSFKPTTSATRTFPALKYLVQNIYSYKGERIPDTVRKVKFRCTLRDINNGYGAFYTSADSVTLDVRKTTTLFRVNSQNTAGQTFDGNAQLTVTWDVAGTNAAPFNANNVNIFFSDDSCKNFNYTLATNLPNNGSATVYLPNINTNWGRIKVKAANNVWFDLNDNWIIVKMVNWPAATNDIIQKKQMKLYPNPHKGNFTIEYANMQGKAQIEIVDIAGKKVYEQIIQTQKTEIQWNAAKGIYLIKLHDGEKTITEKMVVE